MWVKNFKSTTQVLFRGKFSVYFAKVVFTVNIEVEKVLENQEGQQITGRHLDNQQAPFQLAL